MGVQMWRGVWLFDNLRNENKGTTLLTINMPSTLTPVTIIAAVLPPLTQASASPEATRSGWA